ncbi:MAG: phosphate ABC transporter substrate-binding protein [Rhodospirillaceae bacterium]|nr:phosphate ABC transporter substrate-binding protein [Rhodospirillaceae bacterium]|tara:strand:- start:755 stop:1765 length:1011 start_codon:yes stop_codon:yes gene_type:complete
MKIKTITLAAAITVGLLGAAEARDQIRIVGSSTVFPFSTAVAEKFGKSSSFKTPVVESTGTGGGMKLFCAGVGENHPDMTNASRRMKKSEFEKCTTNGINVTEVKIGFDGIVIANAKTGPDLTLSLEQIFLALASEIPQGGKLVANPNKLWSDIDPSLPNTKIEVLGPPPTSGTRDAFVEIAMEGGCKTLAGAAKLGLKKKACHAVREDGAYIEAGENDNLIVQKLESNPNAFGIFGFSFLDQNADKLKGASVNGTEPEFEEIAAGNYSVSRSLFFYVKQQHVGVIPGIKAFVTEFTNENAWGPDGYLIDKGLIPLPDADRATMAKQAQGLMPLSM